MFDSLQQRYAIVSPAALPENRHCRRRRIPPLRGRTRLGAISRWRGEAQACDSPPRLGDRIPLYVQSRCSVLPQVAINARLGSRVLIASDDRELTAALALLLARYLPEVAEANAPSVLARLAHGDGLRLLILGDAGLDSGALDLLQTIKERHPDLAVLLVSAHPTIEHATESIRLGAEDFVPVPYSDEVVIK